jgi:hypothetical protein
VRNLILDILVVNIVLGAAALALALPTVAAVRITEIIDSTGDGGGNSLDEPTQFAVDSNDNVYVTGMGSDNAFKITPGGTITEVIDSTGDGGGNSLSDPWGVAVDTSGNVYVTGAGSDNAFKITPGGTITEIIDATGDGGNSLSDPWGVAVDTSGNVYVTGMGSDNAFKIATPGTCSTSGSPCTITEIIDATGDGGNTLDAPYGVAVDTSGNVYVAGYLSLNAFKIATPGTCSTTGSPCTITEIIDSTGSGGGNTLDYPYGIAADSSGNVYVAGSFSDNAFKILTPGTCSTTGTPCTIGEIIDSTGSGGGNTLDGPYGISVDSSGNVYVTGMGSNNTFKRSGGTITEIIDSTGDGGGNTLSGPWGVAVDSSGNAYVTGRFTDNAFKVAQPTSSKWVVDIDFSFTEFPLVGSVVPIEWTGTGVATVNGIPGGLLSSVRLPDAISGSTIIPLTDPDNTTLISLRMTGVGPGTITFNGILDGPPLGSKKGGALQGQMKMCILFRDCISYLPIPFSGGTGWWWGGGIGLGGLFTVNTFSKAGGFKLSMQAAPWTIGLASIWNGTTMTTQGSGFVHGPASATSTVVLTSGVVQLVTPAYVQTNLAPPDTYSALTSVLKVRFIPEPGLPLLLVAGVVGLVVLGARRANP